MQRVFITGASSGIGAALASLYAEKGAQLALVGRREDALRALQSRLPGEHSVYALDVRNRDALHAAAHDFLSRGPVDIVIAGAGISVGTVTEELQDFEVFQSIMATNVSATVATFEPFIAPMKSRASGTLVGIASVAGVRGLPGAGAYSASKAAVRAYCESLRVEMRGSGVKVVTIAPGFIKTPMTENNPYHMPFLMPVETFAVQAAKVIENGTAYKVLPWQMGWVARLLALTPNVAFDFFAAGRKRKPRKS